MPGFDGKGPTGQGPMTGRGLGFCSQRVTQTPSKNPPPNVVGVGRGGIPWGGGRGRAFGGGGRRGRFGRFF